MNRYLKYFVLLLVLAIFGCQEKILVEPDDAEPVASGKIEIQMSILNKSTSATRVQTEQFLKTTYQAKAKAGVNIVSWQWTIAENNYQSSNSMVEFWHAIKPGSITFVNLVGVDDKGQAHMAVDTVEIVHSLDGLPGLAFVSSAPAGTSGLYNLVFAAHKKSMQGLGNGAYGYTGSVTGSPWTIKTIAPVDTNLNLVNGSLVPANTGDIGKFVAIRVSLVPADYEVHAGRIDQTTGRLIWASSWGPFADGNFSLLDQGSVKPLVPANLPGSGGDQGPNAVIRRDINAASLTIYTNHFSPFIAGFVQLQDSSGVWQTPLAETSVEGFPNWGKIEIPFSNFPIPQVLFFRFGPSINSPAVLSTHMPGSSYWDTSFQYLVMKVVVLSKKSG
ncbi:MAG: hypothetical protein WC456_04025 [Patescibacteria group bacterium]